MKKQETVLEELTEAPITKVWLVEDDFIRVIVI